MLSQKGDCSSVVECLYNMHLALGSIPTPKKGDIRRNFLLLLVPEYFLDNRLNNTLHIEYDLRRKNDLAPNVLILDWTN